MEVVEYSLHDINVKETSPSPIAFDGEAKGLTEYASTLINDLFESPRSKAFKFTDMDELVPSSLISVLNGGSWKEKTDQIANKLHAVEVRVQERIKHIQDVKKGGLLQLKVSEGGWTKFVLIKIDNDVYLDEEVLELKSGLPAGSSRLQKAAIVTFTPENQVDELVLSDSKSSITDYWYSTFLIAEELQSSESNTKNAFNHIDKLLNDEVKKVSPVDYWFLRNDIINHFRNEDALAYDELVEKVKKHKPETNEFRNKFDDFVKKFEELPAKSQNTKKPFETQFNITPEVIKARIVRTVTLDENFELRLKADIKDLKTKIKAKLDENNKKYLKIYTDSGYDQFYSPE